MFGYTFLLFVISLPKKYYLRLTFDGGARKDWGTDTQNCKNNLRHILETFTYHQAVL